MSDTPRSQWRIALLLCGAVFSTAAAAETMPVTDPTRPPYLFTSAKQTDNTLLLYSTRISGARRTAVINNRVVSVGTRIAGAVVTAIEPGRVTLRRDSKAIVLQLIETPVRRAKKDSS